MRKFTMKHCRKSIGYTQVEMADRLGVDVRTYQRYEGYINVIPFPIANEFSKVVGMELNGIILDGRELE